MAAVHLRQFIPPSTMQRLTSAVLVSISILLAGCASAPKGDGSSPPPSTAGAAEARIAAPVTIPAASARKLVLTMTGPKMVTESKDWPEFKREWRETFAEHAKQSGVAFSFLETSADPVGEDGTLLSVNVADYRIVSIGMRIMFGIMTGNAYIDAQVVFTNLRDKQKFGEQQYYTTSSAAGGIFSKVTPQQVDQIASNVFLDLKAAK